MNDVSGHASMTGQTQHGWSDPPTERRVHMRAFYLWSELCDGQRLPSAEALLRDPRCTFGDLSVVIAVDPGCQADVVEVGDGLPMPVTGLPVGIADIPGRSVISRITEHYLEPIANRAPVGFEAEFTDESGADILYRAIALPCSSDGIAIDAVVGVISFTTAESAAPPVVSRGASPPTSGKPGKTEEQSSTPSPMPTFSKDQIRRIVMSYKDKLAECMNIDGALAVALVDLSSGMALASEQGSSAKRLNLEVAAAGNTNVLRAKYETMKNLGINEGIEDILITLGSQIHLIRPVTSESGKGLFIYLALDKAKANLAMARHKLRILETGLEV